jgi:hypothetical protein
MKQLELSGVAVGGGGGVNRRITVSVSRCGTAGSK